MPQFAPHVMNCDATLKRLGANASILSAKAPDGPWYEPCADRTAPHESDAARVPGGRPRRVVGSSPLVRLPGVRGIRNRAARPLTSSARGPPVSGADLPVRIKMPARTPFQHLRFLMCLAAAAAIAACGGGND